MREPSYELDGWRLESGEDRQAAHQGFELPPRPAREALRVGDAAQLLFQILIEENGERVEQCERMWVIVSETLPQGYIGTLNNQPACFEPGDDEYLVLAAEIPFRAEHVVDIGSPPEDYVKMWLGEPPTRLWDRA